MVCLCIVLQTDWQMYHHDSHPCVCSSSPTRSGVTDEGLFKWDPKAKEEKNGKGPGAKKKRGASKDSKPHRKRKAPGQDALFSPWLPQNVSALLLHLGKATIRALRINMFDVTLYGADKPEDTAIEQASAAPNLATAPHDGPDEPLWLCHDPPDGREPSSLCLCTPAKATAGASCLTAGFCSTQIHSHM